LTPAEFSFRHPCPRICYRSPWSLLWPCFAFLGRPVDYTNPFVLGDMTCTRHVCRSLLNNSISTLVVASLDPPNFSSLHGVTSSQPPIACFLANNAVEGLKRTRASSGSWPISAHGEPSKSPRTAQHYADEYSGVPEQCPATSIANQSQLPDNNKDVERSWGDLYHVPTP
jgi:hypothetical protein